MHDPHRKSSFQHFLEVLMVNDTDKSSENEMPQKALMSIDGNDESEAVAVFLSK